MTSPSVFLWKTVQHRQYYLSRWLIKFRTQYNTQTGPQTDDIWCILWRQREREAVATDFLRRPYATPQWRWFWHANQIYGITAFMLNGLCGNMPIFLEHKFLILEHNLSFGFVPYRSSVLIYKNRPQGNPPLTARLSCQWGVTQQRDSRPASYVSVLSHHFSGSAIMEISEHIYRRVRSFQHMRVHDVLSFVFLNSTTYIYIYHHICIYIFLVSLQTCRQKKIKLVL